MQIKVNLLYNSDTYFKINKKLTTHKVLVYDGVHVYKMKSMNPVLN